MPETSLIRYTHEEVLKLLVKDAGIHEGKWQLTFHMALQTGRMPIGGESDKVYPGAAMIIQALGLQLIEKDVPIQPGSIYVDAAEVNPKKEGAKE